MSDLASRVRHLVDAAVEPVTLDEVTHRRPARRHSRGLSAALAAVLVLIVVAALAVVVARDGGSPERRPANRVASTLLLDEIPDGVSVQQFGEHLVFVVRDEAKFTVFDTNVQHLPGESALWWCPTEQIFVAPTHAETFAKSGKAIGGPAMAGLDRYTATVKHGKLAVDLSRLVHGQKGNTQTAAGQGGGNSAGAWDSGPGSFCEGALKAVNATPRSVLDVEALASIAYDKQVYNVSQGLTEIRFSGATGLLFTFDDPAYRYCLLATDRGAPHACRVYLTPGDYLVYDAVPGHRQAGLQATIHVDSSVPISGLPATTETAHPAGP